MKGLACIILAVMFISSTAHATRAPLTSPAELEERIAHEGAKAVVADLTRGSGHDWNRMIGRISSGQPAWLKIASALKPGVDAGTAEDLTYALAKALQKNPTNVLSMAGSDFQIKDICQVPLIEPSDAQFKQWKDASLSALNKVRLPNLREKVNACRASLSAGG